MHVETENKSGLIVCRPEAGGGMEDVQPLIQQAMSSNGTVIIFCRDHLLIEDVGKQLDAMQSGYIVFDLSGLYYAEYPGVPFFNPLVGEEHKIVTDVVSAFCPSEDGMTIVEKMLITRTLKVLKRLDKAVGSDGRFSTFIWMSRVLQDSGGQGRELVRKFSQMTTGDVAEIKENQDIASWFLNQYYVSQVAYQNGAKLRAIIETLLGDRRLKRILAPDYEMGESNQICFEDIIERKYVAVFCIPDSIGRRQQALIEALLVAKLNRAISEANACQEGFVLLPPRKETQM